MPRPQHRRPPPRCSRARLRCRRRERDEEYSRLRIAILERKREVLYRLRREGVVDDAVVTRIQTRLDVEELRITGVEVLD